MVQVEDCGHGIVQGAGADFCLCGENREKGFPGQSAEQGLQPELGNKGISHPSM